MASGVGVALETVPVAEGATLAEALGGGEDYELVIATTDANRLRSVFEAAGLPEPIEIGVVTPGDTRTLGGEPLEALGFSHDVT